MVIASIPYKHCILFLGFLTGIIGISARAQESLLDKIIFLEDQAGTINAVLRSIEAEGDLTFSYGNVVPGKRTIHLEGGRKRIGEFLEEMFAGIPVRFLEKNGKILIVTGPLFQSIRGSVRDLESGSPLIGANVMIRDTDPVLGATTDTNGLFHIRDVPVGRHDLLVKYLGYQPAARFDILVSSGKELYFDVAMKQIFLDLPEVRVQDGNRKGDPKNDMAAVSARSFTLEETGRFPAVVNDPARMALVFSGVRRGDEDLINEMVIRGNPPSKVLWRMEGIEILMPNHFASERNTTGWVNIISWNLLGRTDLLTGAFPAEYGNTLGGVLDISLRSGNNLKNEYSVQLGMLGLDLSAEGPFSKHYNGSYLVNCRYSTTQTLTRFLGESALEYEPRYWDLCYKIHLPTKRSGNFSFWGLGGAGKAIRPNSDDISDTIQSKMMALGLSHLYIPNDRSYVRSVVSLSMNMTDQHEDFLVPVRIPLSCREFSLFALRASVKYRYKFSPRLAMNTGGTFSHLIYDYFQFRTLPGKVNSAGNTFIFQGYLQGKYYLARELYLNAGVHFLHFNLNGNSLLEPRLGIKWNFSKEQSLGLGFGMHSQHEYLSTYFQQARKRDGTYTMPNGELGLAKAIHYVLSYDNSLIRNVHFNAELYYQDLYNLPVKKSPTYTQAPVNFEHPFDTMVNIGTGRNYGFEMSVEKYFSRGYYFLLSSSLYDSKIDPGNDTLYNTAYNARFALKIAGGKEFAVGRSKQDLLGLNAKVIWTGGNRGQRYINDSIMVYPDRYEDLYKDYFRLDVNVSYRFNRPRSSHIVSLDIQNLTNRINIMRENWVYGEGRTEMDVDVQSGRFPFISYRAEF